MKKTYYALGSRLAATLLALCATVHARADYSSTVLSQGPVGYWRFGETTLPATPPILATNIGTVGSAGHGTLVGVIRGAPSAIAGDPGNASMSMPGAAGSADGFRVRVPFQPEWNRTGPYSVEFWAKPGQNTALASPGASVEFIASVPVAQRNGWLIYQGDPGLATGNGWVFRQYNSTGLGAVTSANAPMPININHWYHIVCTFDGTSLRVYVDGTNAVTTALAGTARANTNPAVSLSFGARSDGASGFFTWNGLMDEAAVYTNALSAGQVLTHYQTGTNVSPGTPYKNVVLADNPAGYWRLGEPADPTASNLGSLGAAGDAKYVYNVQPGQAGPRPSAFPGFEAGNNAFGFDGISGYVSISPLNLNTNTVTMTAWVKPVGPLPANAGIVFQRARTSSGGAYSSTAGITHIAGGLLGYNWDGHNYTFAAPPLINDSEWSLVALTVHPDYAVLFVPGQPPVTNIAPHAALRFEGITYVGEDPWTNAAATDRRFSGVIDEVAIFNRALTLGEIYTEYATAVGSTFPTIFGDPQAPLAPLYAGDPLTLSVDAGGSTPLSYQWRKGGVPIGGATGSSYSVASLATGDSGNYDVVVTNGFGPAISQPAAISVASQIAPAFVTDIQLTNRTLYAGGAIKLSVSATGGGLGYQWKRNGGDLAGQTKSSLVINGITNGNAGTYTVVVTNGTGSATSQGAVISLASPLAGSYESYVSADAPISWYRMDDPTNSAFMLDAMGRWDGIYTNNAGPVSLGVPGALAGDGNTSAHFDLSSQAWGEVPTLPPPITTGDITIECWARSSDTTANLSPVSTFRDNYGWFIRRDTVPSWRAADAYGDLDTGVAFRVSPSDPFTAGQWVHLTLVESAAVGQKLYINGVWDNNGPYLDFSRALDVPLRVGAALSASVNSYFSGEIDEVAVYNRALTDPQILSHYQSAQFPPGVKPFFTIVPASQTAISNSAATLTFVAQAQGSYPVTYQWYKNGSPIAGATTTTISVSGAYSNAALYQITASNPAGSSNVTASLSLIPAGPPFAGVLSNLVLHLKFDGDYSDSSGHGNNATAVASPSVVAGRIGSGAVQYSSDGSTFNYLTLGNPTDLRFSSNVNFSVAYWVQIPYVNDAPATNGDLPFLCSALNSYGGQGMTFAPSYKLGGWSYSMNGVVQLYGPNNSINNGWHHLVHTFDRTGFAITYLDGARVDSRLATAIGDLDNVGPINIGQDPSGMYSEIGIHQLDDLAIWRRALTAYEAYGIYYVATNSNSSFDTVTGVTLNLSQVGTNLVITWRPGTTLGTLEQATTLLGPWSAVGVYAPLYQFPPTGTQKYFRLRIP